MGILQVLPYKSHASQEAVEKYSFVVLYGHCFFLILTLGRRHLSEFKN